MISLILPYYERREAADASLRLMARQYPGLSLEVVLVDDGSSEPYYAPVDLPFPVRVLYGPQKDQPLNPCTPINVGAAAASGDYIALSNPEILHVNPVLPELLAECQRGGPLTYALAACWDPEKKRWHCHSTNRRDDSGDVGSFLPPGTDYHFMAMLHRSLWELAGGFDEDYRDGAGYDDPDFVLRLHRCGARFVIRDDLVVEHPRRGAKANWRPEMFARNRKVFLSKWKLH